MPVTLLLTRRLSMLSSACLLKIILLGVSSLPLLGVAVLDKGTTIACEPRLDQGQA